MTAWQLQNAKTHLSEVIEDANTKGPQVITRHGRERAVVVSVAEYQKLSAHSAARKPESSLIELLLGGPKLADDDPFFEALERDRKDTGRTVEL